MNRPTTSATDVARFRRPARLLVLIIATAMVGAAAAPAGASVRVDNLVRGNLSTVDEAPLYGYWSGSMTTWDSGPEFRSGTTSSTRVTPVAGRIVSVVQGGVVALITNLKDDGSEPSWGPAWPIPGAPAAQRTGVAISPLGLVQVVIIDTGGQVRVARQTSPGVWAPIPTWTTLGTSAADADITVGPAGVFSVVWRNLAGQQWTRIETAPGVWSAATSQPCCSTAVAVTEYSGDLRVAAITGVSTEGIWAIKETSPGVWGGWTFVCRQPTAQSDVSVVVNGAGFIQIYTAGPSGVYSCRQTSATAWTAYRTHTGSYTGIGADRLPSGSTVLTAVTSTGDLIASVGDGLGAAGSWGAWTATLASGVTDVGFDAYDAGQTLRLTGTGTLATSGTWTSPVIDTGTGGIAGLLRIRGAVPAGTTASVQVAGAATSPPPTFVGPDGTSATSYSIGDHALPYSFDGLRFVRLRVTLTGPGTATPTITALSVGYNLWRIPRSSDGTPTTVLAPGTATSWATRMSTSAAWPSTGTTRLNAAATSTWGTNSLTAGYDDPAPRCCAATQLSVTGGTASSVGTAGTAPVVAGGRTGQSVVLQRTSLSAGTVDLTSRIGLSPSLTVEIPQRIGLMWNTARSGTATQSSNDTTGPPSAAIDDNTSGNYPDGSVTATAPSGTAQPWWRLDLGSTRTISELRLWNRTDCCSDRLSDLVVLVSPTPITETSLDTAISAVAAAGGSVTYLPGQALTSHSLLFPPGVTGRYVQVQLRARSGILSLAEVEVLGA